MDLKKKKTSNNNPLPSNCCLILWWLALNSEITKPTNLRFLKFLGQFQHAGSPKRGKELRSPDLCSHRSFRAKFASFRSQASLESTVSSVFQWEAPLQTFPSLMLFDVYQEALGTLAFSQIRLGSNPRRAASRRAWAMVQNRCLGEGDQDINVCCWRADWWVWGHRWVSDCPGTQHTAKDDLEFPILYFLSLYFSSCLKFTEKFPEQYGKA